MGKGALRPFFKGHSLKKEKEHEKRKWTKCFRILSHSLFKELIIFPLRPDEQLRCSFHVLLRWFWQMPACPLNDGK